MDEHELDGELAIIGDRLEAAVDTAIERRNRFAVDRHDIGVPTLEEVTMSPVRPTSSRSRRVAIACGLVGLALVGTGVAAAVGGLSTDDVERGMPGGSWILNGTDPTCTTTDDVVYECTLANPPRQERTDVRYRRVTVGKDDAVELSPASSGLIDGEYDGRLELLV